MYRSLLDCVRRNNGQWIADDVVAVWLGDSWYECLPEDNAPVDCPEHLANNAKWATEALKRRGFSIAAIECQQDSEGVCKWKLVEVPTPYDKLCEALASYATDHIGSSLLCGDTDSIDNKLLVLSMAQTAMSMLTMLYTQGSCIAPVVAGLCCDIDLFGPSQVDAMGFDNY